MEKIDFKKTEKHLYRPAAKAAVEVDVPSMNFLMIDGLGAPGCPDFVDAVSTLYPVAYTLKFMAKQGALATDYVVLPLEGLWSADDWSVFKSDDRDAWKWTVMIRQPGFLTQEMVEEAIAAVTRKKNPPAIANLRFAAFEEGLCAQIMHIGPFSEEGPTVDKLHAFIDARGELRGKHHEIYLSDVRRAAPANWKTVIRQPMRTQPA